MIRNRGMHPRPRQGAIGCENTAVRQVARTRRLLVQPYRIYGTGRHVGAGAAILRVRTLYEPVGVKVVLSC